MTSKLLNRAESILEIQYFIDSMPQDFLIVWDRLIDI